MDSTTNEYRIVVSGAGWVDRSERGWLRFEGDDVLSFLQALVTNDVARLGVRQGVYAAYLTPQGRMVADFELYRRPDGVLVSVVPGMAPALTTRLDQLIFSEDVRVADVSADLAEIAVVGGRAAEILGQVLSVDDGALAGLGALSQLDFPGGFVARIEDASLPMFIVVMSAERRDEIVRNLEAAGAAGISRELEEGLRIEAGRPRFGVDMTEETIPLEAGLLERAISTTKGCYVGQEIVIRILHRGGGRVARRLATLTLDAAGPLPLPGALLLSAEREVGRLTSVARTPADGVPIALGWVHRDVAEVGNALTVSGVPPSTATVSGFAH